MLHKLTTGTADAPVCVSSRASRLRRTEAATPSASRACWEFWAAAFSTVWRSRGMKSEAWLKVSPTDGADLKIKLTVGEKGCKSNSMTLLVWLTFESPQHGLKVGLSDQGGGGLQSESFLQPVEQSGRNLHSEAAAPLRQHRHCVHQGALVNWKRRNISARLQHLKVLPRPPPADRSRGGADTPSCCKYGMNITATEELRVWLEVPDTAWWLQLAIPLEK